MITFPRVAITTVSLVAQAIVQEIILRMPTIMEEGNKFIKVAVVVSTISIEMETAHMYLNVVSKQC